jgi:hypothetical protein
MRQTGMARLKSSPDTKHESGDNQEISSSWRPGLTHPSGSTARLKSGLRSLFGDAFGEEAVADPGLGLDVRARTFGFKFAAKLADKDAQIFRLVR